MKKIIIFLVFILCISFVNSLDECKSPIEPNQIPCEIITTYQLSPNCVSHNVKIYDSTPTLLQTLTYGVYSDTSRCNVTFNISERGSYLLNSSDGSSATIIVEGVKMDFLRLGIFGAFFALGLIFIGFMHKFKEDEGSSIAYGFFSLAVFVILGGVIFFGFDVIDPDLLNTPFNVNILLGIISVVIGIYSAWYSTTLLRYKRRERDEINSRNEYEARW